MVDDILSILLSSIGSAVLLGFAGFLFKEMIKKRLNSAIEHAYNMKLESHKAELDKTKNEEIEKIKNALSKNLESHKAELSNINNQELEVLKAKLQLEYELAKTFLTRYTDKQFELYNTLWSSLCDLKICIQNLWGAASVGNLKMLANQHNIANDQIEKSAILIEQDHYKELKEILKEIGEFKIGKAQLIELRENDKKSEDVNKKQIEEVIHYNESTKRRFEKYLDEFQECLRVQIKGNYNIPNDGLRSS